MTELYVTAFVTLVLVIDPVGLLPMFVSLTYGRGSARFGIALRACIIGAAILAIFGVVGDKILTFVGIGLPAFRISGGLLLFLIAVEMLFNKRGQRREEQSVPANADDPSVFPLATPLIAGPGAMASMILLSSDASIPNATLIVMTAMVSVVLLVFFAFLTGTAVERILGKTGINVITRLMGMLLAALSVQFVVDGLHGLGVL